MLPVSSLNSIDNSTQLSCHVLKEGLEKFSLSELNIEKVKFFTQSSIPNFFALMFLTLEVALEVA